MIKFHSQGLEWQERCLDWLLHILISSISDGFCVNQVYNMGHEDGIDRCRHHILVSDTRGFIFWFACIARLVCSLCFRPQRSDYNREEALQAGLYLNTRLLRRELVPWGPM